MKKIKIVISYDGTEYFGWQFQPNRPTVELACKKALEEVFNQEINLIGASRTDSGVHARGNVAVFDVKTQIPLDKMRYAINQSLPDDIRIEDLETVENDFHPRRKKSKKTYEYRILSRDVSIPTKRLYSHFVYYDLDENKMREALKYLLGKYDFKGLSSKKTSAESTIRKIYKADLTRDGDEIIITIEGSGFLYHMVRIITGTLIEIGRGIFPPERMRTIIAMEERDLAGPTAPACGLTLLKIEYV